MKAAILLLAALPVIATAARAPKYSPEFDTLPPLAMVDELDQYKNVPDFAAQFNISNNGGRLLREFRRAVIGGHYKLPVLFVKLLANDPSVKYISRDRKVKRTTEYAVPAINAAIAQSYGYTGAGIGVAVLDSGVTTGTYGHPDLKASGGSGVSRVVYSESFIDDDTSTNDKYGHGEHVAGIIGGTGAISTQTSNAHSFRGIAPGVNIVNLRVLDAQGNGSDSALIAAIDRAIELKSRYNIRVMNLSLGRAVQESYALDPLCQAVERAWEAGITVVVAAGNGGRNNTRNTQGYGTILSPGNDPFVITVGAMRDMSTGSKGNDLLATYSSKGPTAIDHVVKPDLVAPGNQIVSLKPLAGGTIPSMAPSPVVPASYYGGSNSGSVYVKLSGTSMAAPMVSGAVALLLQKNPSLTPDAVKAILMRTASKTFPVTSTYTDTSTGISYVQHYDVFSVGAGYVDIWAALNYTGGVPAGLRAASPRAVPVAGVGVTLPVSLPVDGSNVIWGGDDNWGGTDVWGTMAFVSGSNVIWGGDDTPWGDDGVTGNSVLWGTNVIWGGDEDPETGFGPQSVVRGDK